jgi:peptidoglycan/LPS O-acetylase OafA/YrhL
MGTLRFILALLVMLSHTGLTVGGLNPGVASVVVFYAISGYVMSALVAKHFSQPGQARYFYIDRLARIYPQYLFYAAAAAVWFFTIGHATPFLQHSPTATDWVNNLLIVPLNFFMFNAADQFSLVPPAWSLGAEVLFYALAPWLWRYWRFAMLLAAWVYKPWLGIKCCRPMLGATDCCLVCFGFLRRAWLSKGTSKAIRLGCAMRYGVCHCSALA